MKVGIVCPYDLDTPGGVQQVALELAAELREGGDQVVVVGAGDIPSSNGADDAGVVTTGRPVRVKANDSVVPLTIGPRSWARVRRALSDVDVVHVHEPLVPVVGWAALSADKPMLVTFHADPKKWVAAAYRHAPLLGRLLKRKTAVTAVSATAAKAIPTAWGQVMVIPNGIDVDSYSPSVDRVAGRVAFLGRDEPRKGLDVLLRAWPRVQERIEGSELKVLGASRDGTVPGVEFLGRVGDEEKRRLLASSQVYAAPNTGGESFGIVIAEAMAAGCAVVCSDLPAFRSVLGDSGRLVPVGDVEKLADEVASLLGDPDGARALGSRAAAEARRYDWATVAAAYRDLYRQALS